MFQLNNAWLVIRGKMYAKKRNSPQHYTTPTSLNFRHKVSSINTVKTLQTAVFQNTEFRKYSNQTIWHHQPCHGQGHRNHPYFQSHVWCELISWPVFSWFYALHRCHMTGQRVYITVQHTRLSGFPHYMNVCIWRVHSIQILILLCILPLSVNKCTTKGSTEKKYSRLKYLAITGYNLKK